MDVVGGRTGVTAKQLPTILADPTEFHVVVILLFRVTPNLFQDLLTLRIVLFSLPLDAFLLLKDHRVRLSAPNPPPWNHAHHPFECFPKLTPAPSPSPLPPGPTALSHLPPLKGCERPWWPGTHAMGAAPLALRSLLHVGIQAHHVVSAGAGVTQDDLATLLAHLTIVLVVCLITIHSSHLLLAWARKRESPVISHRLPPPPLPLR